MPQATLLDKLKQVSDTNTIQTSQAAKAIKQSPASQYSQTIK